MTEEQRNRMLNVQLNAGLNIVFFLLKRVRYCLAAMATIENGIKKK